MDRYAPILIDQDMMLGSSGISVAGTRIRERVRAPKGHAHCPPEVTGFILESMHSKPAARTNGRKNLINSDLQQTQNSRQPDGHIDLERWKRHGGREIRDATIDTILVPA
jgi:hypothetical protein